MKEFVSTFSDSLRETDRNAERLMVEQMQGELQELRQRNRVHEQELAKAYAEIERLKKEK